MHLLNALEKKKEGIIPFSYHNIYILVFGNKEKSDYL